MGTFLIKEVETGVIVFLVDGDSVENVCERFFFNKKTRTRKIGNFHYRILCRKKVASETELIQNL